MFRRNKRDANQGEIVRTLERAGCAVFDLADRGDGCTDLLCFRQATGLLRLLEVKSASGTLTPAQEEFRRRFPVWVVRTPREALLAMEAIAAR
jgi:hypothetical protein